MEDFIWRHSPLLTGEPIELLDSFLEKDLLNNRVTQKAVFKLSNNKYLYIRYFGLIDKPQTGVTDYEEFENLEEARRVFNEY